VDTTLGYARLYDGTVAADYYRAMAGVEQRLTVGGFRNDEAQPSPAYLLALVDALGQGTLNHNQRDIVQSLRSGILALAEAASAENCATTATN